MNPNATWNISLESYHPYLQPKEVSKALTTLGMVACPKVQKAVLAAFILQGLNTY
jgi:hypothetical protein